MFSIYPSWKYFKTTCNFYTYKQVSKQPSVMFAEFRGWKSSIMTKPTKWHVCPAKTQISLGICPVWSESSLCAQCVAKDPSFLHADVEDSDQSGRMPRLIRWSVFAGRRCHFVGFVMMRLKWFLVVIITGLSKHFSYFWMRKQVSRNYMCCVIDRTMSDRQYKCRHVSINFVNIFMFPRRK